jgi:hypothetical protein
MAGSVRAVTVRANEAIEELHCLLQMTLPRAVMR